MKKIIIIYALVLFINTALGLEDADDNEWMRYLVSDEDMLLREVFSQKTDEPPHTNEVLNQEQTAPLVIDIFAIEYSVMLQRLAFKESEKSCIREPQHDSQRSKKRKRADNVVYKKTRKQQQIERYYDKSLVHDYKCDKCRLGFSKESSKDRHDVLHTGHNECSLCGFLQYTCVTQHALYHQEKTFKCEDCKIGFKEEEAFELHNQRTHNC